MMMMAAKLAVVAVLALLGSASCRQAGFRNGNGGRGGNPIPITQPPPNHPPATTPKMKPPTYPDRLATPHPQSPSYPPATLHNGRSRKNFRGAEQKCDSNISPTAARS